MTEEANWLLEWFGRHKAVPGKTVEEQLQVNYFEAGLLDSLGVVEMIVELEEHFDIQFTEEHFQDREFATIGDLSKLVIAQASANQTQQDSPAEFNSGI